jgi:Ca-activated chloride channel family protein
MFKKIFTNKNKIMETVNQNQVKLNVYRIVAMFILAACMHFQIMAQQSIRGTVLNNSDGSPIPGTSIYFKGNTGVSTITDMTGKFTIHAVCPSILVASFIGYVTQEIPISVHDSILEIRLLPEIVSLEEVVVTEYSPSLQYVANELVASACILFESLGKSERKTKCASVMAANNFQPAYLNQSTESYSKINENGFKNSKNDPLSTFSIDVDKASYSNIRRFINQGQLPPADAVRIEEMINYFDYNYAQPTDENPFAIYTEYSDCPWQEGHKILHIGLQGKKIETANLPASNLVFLLDVSGSMDDPNKLPLVISAFKLLVNNLRPNDRIAIVVYAGAAGVVLPSTKGSDKETILNALNSLHAGGSTAGCEGISMAYKIAQENFMKNGNNRVILATDGDFNVGISNENDLENFIVDKRKSGIFLTCLGFGMENYKDSKLELLSDKGNGNYAYINDIQEAHKTLVSEFGGTLFTIAKDVKIQIEFNPNKIAAYRLIGYENRMLNSEDFTNDLKDAGELGAGHTVTALYEVIPQGENSKFVDNPIELKYQQNKASEQLNDNAGLNEIATVKFRYKKPDADKSIEMVQPIPDSKVLFSQASDNLRFASSVAMFGMLLRNSEFKGSCTYSSMIEFANNSRGIDTEGYRGEFMRLVKTANGINLISENTKK